MANGKHGGEPGGKAPESAGIAEKLAAAQAKAASGTVDTTAADASNTPAKKTEVAPAKEAGPKKAKAPEAKKQRPPDNRKNTPPARRPETPAEEALRVEMEERASNRATLERKVAATAKDIKLLEAADPKLRKSQRVQDLLRDAKAVHEEALRGLTEIRYEDDYDTLLTQEDQLTEALANVEDASTRKRLNEVTAEINEISANMQRFGIRPDLFQEGEPTDPKIDSAPAVKTKKTYEEEIEEKVAAHEQEVAKKELRRDELLKEIAILVEKTKGKKIPALDAELKKKQKELEGVEKFLAEAKEDPADVDTDKKPTEVIVEEVKPTAFEVQRKIAERQYQLDTEMSRARGRLQEINRLLAPYLDIPSHRRTIEDNAEMKALEREKNTLEQFVKEHTPEPPEAPKPPEIRAETEKYFKQLDKLNTDVTALRELSEQFQNNKLTVEMAEQMLAELKVELAEKTAPVQNKIETTLSGLPSYQLEAIIALLPKRIETEAGAIERTKNWFESWMGKVKPSWLRAKLGKWDELGLQELTDIYYSPEFNELLELENHINHVTANGLTSEEQQKALAEQFRVKVMKTTNSFPTPPANMNNDEKIAYSERLDEIVHQLYSIDAPPAEAGRSANQRIRELLQSAGRARELFRGNAPEEEVEEKQDELPLAEQLGLDDDLAKEYRLSNMREDLKALLESAKDTKSRIYIEDLARETVLGLLIEKKNINLPYFRAYCRAYQTSIDDQAMDDAWRWATQEVEKLSA